MTRRTVAEASAIKVSTLTEAFKWNQKRRDDLRWVVDQYGEFYLADKYSNDYQHQKEDQLTAAQLLVADNKNIPDRLLPLDELTKRYGSRKNALARVKEMICDNL